MADRSTAALFGRIFDYLAESNTPRSRAFAREVWWIMEDGGYDFSRRQMEADDALVTLGLATRHAAADGVDDDSVAYAGDDDGPGLPVRGVR